MVDLGYPVGLANGRIPRAGGAMRKTIAMIVMSLAIAGCGGGGNERLDTPPVPAPAPEPEPPPPEPEPPPPEPEPPPPPEPAPPPPPEPEPPPPPEPEPQAPPEPAPAPSRSLSRIPGAGDYAPVEGAAAFRNDPEYQGLDAEGNKPNWALDRVRAADAYARLESGVVPGAGIRIAVVDDGIDKTHWELMPADDADRLTATGILGGRADFERYQSSHGTAVTSLILADKHTETGRQDESFHGIAYGAHVDVYGIPLGVSSGDAYRPPLGDVEGLARGAARAQVQILQEATKNNPHVVNMSFTRSVMAEQYIEDRALMARGLETLLAFVKGESGTIFVQAAGNSNGKECAERSYTGCASGRLEATSPDYDAALPLWDSSGDVGKRWVAVVATDRDNAMAHFSNRCGLAARWCLAAPGKDVLIAYSGPRDVWSVDPVTGIRQIIRTDHVRINYWKDDYDSSFPMVSSIFSIT